MSAVVLHYEPSLVHLYVHTYSDMCRLMFFPAKSHSREDHLCRTLRKGRWVILGGLALTVTFARHVLLLLEKVGCS
jgi:hypothetical protein